MKPTTGHYAYGTYRYINNILLYYEAMPIEESRYTTEILEPGLAYKYQGDFYGLLTYLQVEPRFFLPSLYLNDLTTPYDFDGRTLTIKIAGDINFPKQ